jgi:hypothetical protein
LRGLEDVKSSALAAAAETMAASATIQKELLFQHTKQYKNQIQAYLDGHLLVSEIPSDMVETAQAFRLHQGKLDKDRDRQEARQHKLMSTLPPKIGRQLVFLQNHGWACLPGLGDFKFTAAMHMAKFFVVPDASAPGRRIQWTVSLQGGCVVDQKFLQSQGAGPTGTQLGVCFTHDAAISVQRKLFVCPDFIARHGRLADIVKKAMAKPEGKWGQVRSWEEFAQLSEAANRRSRPLTVVALTTPEVCAALDLKNVFSKKSFLDFVTQTGCSNRGACGT